MGFFSKQKMYEKKAEFLDSECKRELSEIHLKLKSGDLSPDQEEKLKDRLSDIERCLRKQAREAKNEKKKE